MSKLFEYINPHAHVIQLSSADKQVIRVPAKSKIVLSDWYLRYCPKFLRVIRALDNSNSANLKLNNIDSKKYDLLSNNKIKQIKINKPINKNSAKNRIPNPKQVARAQVTARQLRNRVIRKKRRVVGIIEKRNAQKIYVEACQRNKWSISKNIGVGILSYNRLDSLKRLVSSIRKYTDLSRVTLFVSDESTDENILNWLEEQKDLIYLANKERLGIAGNTNRLLKCLSRFKYNFILNDDVEILEEGWEDFYVKAARETGYHHFCYQQDGVYGYRFNGKKKLLNGHTILTINERPHGAILFYTNDLFNKIGYFDEQFGIYGMEHVDWSTRAYKSGMQPPGFHDILGSNKYFAIHPEKSAVDNRIQKLQRSRLVYDKIKSLKDRIFVNCSEKITVPSVSVIIPIKNKFGLRNGATETVVDSIRSQLFPNIEIIVVEQDIESRIDPEDIKPAKYLLAKSKDPEQLFNKSLAFNAGVDNSSHDIIVLHDADIICPSDYLIKLSNLVKKHGGAHIGSKVIYLDEPSTKNVIFSKKITTNKRCTAWAKYFEGGSLACTKEAYCKCGGFNEIFEGYGSEDCDFFRRLEHITDFYNKRTIEFIHLHHGRQPNWGRHGSKNDRIYSRLCSINIDTYIKDLILENKKIYPELYKQYNL